MLQPVICRRLTTPPQVITVNRQDFLDDGHVRAFIPWDESGLMREAGSCTRTRIADTTYLSPLLFGLRTLDHLLFLALVSGAAAGGAPCRGRRAVRRTD